MKTFFAIANLLLAASSAVAAANNSLTDEQLLQIKFDQKIGGTGSAVERHTSAQHSEGVYIECRAISLTRDIPLGLGWIIEPIIRKLPQESLTHTLECTRKALGAS